MFDKSKFKHRKKNKTTKQWPKITIRDGVLAESKEKERAHRMCEKRVEDHCVSSRDGEGWELTLWISFVLYN